MDLSLLEPCKLLCFGSLLLTAEPSRSTVERLVRYAKAQGKITAYDPNWRPPLWKGREEEGVQRMKSLIPLADIMKVSGEELELLTGKESLEEGAWALLEQGVSLAVVTLGARGCKAFAPGLSLEKPTYDTKVKDTQGEGHDRLRGQLLWGAAGQDYPVRQAAGAALPRGAGGLFGLRQRGGLHLRYQDRGHPGAAHHPGDRGLPQECAAPPRVTEKRKGPAAQKGELVLFILCKQRET